MAILQLLEADRWLADQELWICPCLNPTGFSNNSRENSAGHDLNRDYRHLRTPEVRTHVRWLSSQPDFDVAICLHEDWEAKGFYLYELNPDAGPSRAEAVIDAVRRVCPVDPSEVIETWEAPGSIIRVRINPLDRPEWPEALYLVMNKTRHSYTMEAPSDFELPVRVSALVTAVEAALAIPTH
jgi:hypothetical protein